MVTSAPNPTGVPRAGGPMRTTNVIVFVVLLTGGLAPSELEALASGCTGVQDGTACDDGNVCTAGDRCQAEVCIVPVTLTNPAGSPMPVVEPKDLEVADLNGDGKQDLIALDYSNRSFTALLGNGTGQFALAPGSPMPTEFGEQALTVADFNLDGKIDVAVAYASYPPSPGKVTVFLGHGDGSFTLSPVPPILTGSHPSAIVAADFNHDGKSDLVMSEQNFSLMHILLGTGSGGFTEAPGSPIPGGSGRGVFVDDLNLDGKLDIAAYNRANAVTISLGNGMGGFTPGPDVPEYEFGTRAIAGGDLNFDGKPDLVVATQIYVDVFLGDGTGAFSRILQFMTPMQRGDFSRVSIGDFNIDGKPDVAKVNYGLQEISFLLGDGAGGFVEFRDPSFAVFTPIVAPIGDFNGDGKPDLAVGTYLGDTVTIFLNGTPVPPSGSACSDGNACTGTATALDSCDGAGRCIGGQTLTCSDDDNPCTDDHSCEPLSGCVYANNTNPCDDGDACTIGDTCGGGACAGNPVICSALDQCHVAGTCTAGACSDLDAPDGTVCDDGDAGTGNDICTGGTCAGTEGCALEPKPKNYGYYKKLCKDGHSHPNTQEDLLTTADAACVSALTQTFSGISMVEDLCAVLERTGGSGDGYDSKDCNRGEQELMATALNVCSQRVCLGQEIDSSCATPNHVLTSVQASLETADGILSDPSRDKIVCKEARCLTKEINNGHGLHHTSLQLTRGSGTSVRLSWGSPIMDDGSGEASSYSIWRRPLHSGGAFARLADTPGLTYLDYSAASGAWEYEVTFTIEP